MTSSFPPYFRTRVLARELDQLEYDLRVIRRKIAVMSLFPQTALTRSILESLQVKLEMNELIASSTRARLAELTGEYHWSRW